MLGIAQRLGGSNGSTLHLALLVLVSFHVTTKVSREALTTVVTPIRPLASMRSHMFGQSPTVRETLLTDWAAEWLFAAVGPQVISKNVGLGESFSTQMTAMEVFTSVYSHMEVFTSVYSHMGLHCP